MCLLGDRGGKRIFKSVYFPTISGETARGDDTTDGNREKLSSPSTTAIAKAKKKKEGGKKRGKKRGRKEDREERGLDSTDELCESMYSGQIDRPLRDNSIPSWKALVASITAYR